MQHQPRTSPPGADPEPIREMARSFWSSAVLRAGVKLDVFSLLGDAPLSAADVARRFGGSPRYVQALLDACVVLGLLETKDDAYTCTTLSSECLVKGKEAYVGDIVLHHTNTWASLGRLDELIRDGRTLLPYESGFVDAPTYWTNYMMGQHNRAESGQAANLVAGVSLHDRRRLLDLGGGAASYSIALCEAWPNLQAVVVDRSEPLGIAGSLVRERGLDHRISLLEGDFFEIDVGRDYDAALISGVVLITPEEDCRRLFKLAYEHLLPGGMVIVQDFMRIDHSPGRTKLNSLEDLYVLAVFNPRAGVREGAEVASWLEDAGFHSPALVPVPTDLGIVVAHKPA